MDGAPAFGGTPSDSSVVRLIGELKERGLGVVLYPFVMMDVPAGNALPDPQTGKDGQPAYPWRGRITCSPAPGRAGSPDGTAAAAEQVESFFNGEWGLRRQILHYAALAAEAGGVDGFIVGSEFLGLTRVRSGPGSYPAVAQLKSVVGAVRDILGAATKITYAADWTEYGAHVLDGVAEVRFPLDALWSAPAVDAVGIDWYPPLSDWRDGEHLDGGTARSVYDADYLREGMGSGEGFDWFYADSGARAAQLRTPITDGAYGKPWVFRPKDLVSWWSNPHVERVGGVETGPTAWVPQSKPIWLTEVGIPAVDKGTNGPNVFPDAKSSESAFPPHSRGLRDDLMQVRGLEAVLSRFDPAGEGFVEAHNPVSPLYGGRMVDADWTSVWAWDARPYPAFPDVGGVWADARNWQTGHWITGRLEGVALDRLIAAVLADFEIATPRTMDLDGFVDGYAIDRPMSARAALEPLTSLSGIDAVASAGTLAWRGPGGRAVTALSADELILPPGEPALRLVRAQETELPHQVELGFTDAEREYRRAAVGSRRLAGSSRREQRTDSALVIRRAEAQRLADAWLQNVWAARETAEFAVSPRRLDIEPGDLVTIPTQAGPKLHRVVRIADGPTRRVATRSVEPAVYAASGGLVEAPVRPPPPEPGRPFVLVLDLPAARGDPTVLQYLAAAADPWPGALAVWRGGDAASFSPVAVIEVPAIVGRTLTVLGPGPLWRWDPASVEVEISSGAIPSIGDEAALGGGNLFAVQGLDGRWEIFSAGSAELIGARTYRLSRLLRGLAGSEPEAARTVPAGATIVRLDEAVLPLTASLSDLGQTWRYRIGPADRDHADDAVVEISARAGPDALKPLSPVHIRARRKLEGIEISWVRRTRRDGDPWEPIEVPLAEEQEGYEVEILQAGAVLRTLTSSAPRVTYAGADELADLGGPQAALTVRVAQMSAAVGRGFARSVVVPIA